MRIERATNWSDLSVRSEGWNRLVQSSGACSIFLTWEWLSSWWEAYGAGRDLMVLLVFEDSGDLAGIAPLYVAAAPKRRELRLVGDGTFDSDSLGLIGPVQGQILRWLAANREDWSVAGFNRLSDPSLLVELRRQGWTTFVQRRPHPVLELPSTWDAYLQMLSGNQRSAIKRRLRKLEGVQLRRCEGDVENWLNVLFDLHTRRWNQLGEPGAFAYPGRKHLFHLVAARFLSQGWLDFWILELDGTPVSVEFGFTFQGTYCFLQSGFEPQFEEQGVGVALKALVIQQLIARGIRYYDFLAGDEPYKARWGASNREYLDVACAPPLSAGAALIAFRRAAYHSKNLLRSLLPVRAGQRSRRGGASVQENS